MYYATNIFTGERSPMFYTEEEMDGYIAGYDADTTPARFDVYYNGRLVYYAWNKAYYTEYIADKFCISANYNYNHNIEQKKHKRWM